MGAIRWGTRGIRRTVVATLATIADAIEREGLRAPAVLVVGDVVELRQELAWFERRPLFGKRIVVTRADRAALDGRALAGRQLAAVGAATAQALASRGLLADVVPERASSEGLVEALAQRDWLDRAWLHVRADEGRDVLRAAIEAAGGRYLAAASHRTVRPAVHTAVLDALRSVADGGEGFDTVCLASGKTARHLLMTLTEAWGETTARARLDAARLVAVGAVTAAKITELGLRVDAIAASPTGAAMLDAVTAALAV